MGMPPHVSVCADVPAAVRRPGDPVPTRFDVEQVDEVAGHAVALVRYPDAVNFEGLKVLLYRDCDERTVRAQAFLDPHFCRHDDHLAPFARFEPTPDGWWAARALARVLPRPQTRAA